MQIPRQIAAVLMLPEPVRADAPLGSGAPVLQRNRYAIEHLVANHVLFVPPDLVVMRIGTIVATNRTYAAEEIPVASRTAQVAAVWRRREEFPAGISGLLRKHMTAVSGGSMIGPDAEDAVAAIQRAVSESSADLGVIYSEAADVLPALTEALNLEVPAPLLEVADVDVEDLPTKKRALREWRRWVNARGPASARFRQRVRDAYRATCVVCGAHFPPTPASPGPGVDAAHILPWSDYALDDVANGLCLCKLDHWAFDESLLRVRFLNGDYHVEVPDETRDAVVSFDHEFSIDRVTEHTGLIPISRLPRDRAHWPQPRFLLALQDFVE